VVIRQTIRATLTRFQVLLAPTDIELGFIVIGLSLLPMLISIFNLPHRLVVRYSSVIAALVLALWLVFRASLLQRYVSKLPISAWLLEDDLKVSMGANGRRTGIAHKKMAPGAGPFN
jgi:hypothetical protein